jgi:hypothetical protein
LLVKFAIGTPPAALDGLAETPGQPTATAATGAITRTSRKVFIRLLEVSPQRSILLARRRLKGSR